MITTRLHNQMELLLPNCHFSHEHFLNEEDEWRKKKLIAARFWKKTHRHFTWKFQHFGWKFSNFKKKLRNFERKLPNLERKFPNLERKFPNFEIKFPNLGKNCLNFEKKFSNFVWNVPWSWYLRFRAKCVNCNGMYRVSARGGLFGADGGDMDFDDVLSMVEPFGLIIVDVDDNGHKKARCNSHPTSDIMLAFLKYGVTSRKNLTANKQINK